MRLPFPLAAIYERALARRFAAIARDQGSPLEAQERTYRALRAGLRGTEVARRTGLSDAGDLQSFAASVPVTDHAWYGEMIARVVDGAERRVLFRGPPELVGLTSGTTGSGDKRIVHDRASIQAFRDYELFMGVITGYHSDYNPFFDNRLSWGASSLVTRTARGVEQGYISGYMAAHPRRFVRRHTFPSEAVSRIPDMKRKIREAAPELRRTPIHLLSAVPSYALNLLEELSALWGVGDFSRIWPDLQIVLYGGTPIHPYRAQIAKLVGRPVQFMGMYVATEGPLGYELPSLNGGVNGLFSFHLASIVFTFRKLGGDGRVLTIADLAAGDEVELLLTTPNGLVQYRIGDCLRIHGTRPLLFEVTGRVGHGLNVATEKATLIQLTRAVSRAAAASPALVRHFFVCPDASDTGVPHYAWTLLVDRPEAVDRGAMIAALDGAMMEENGVYREVREEGSLSPPRLVLLDASVAARYFERDAHRGQLKMKTAFESREKLDAFLAGLGVEAGHDGGPESPPNPPGHDGGPESPPNPPG
jgi:hypothetical protein